MVTKLDRPLRREVLIGKEPWIVTLLPKGLKLTRKGKRNGIELDWKSMSNGDAALAAALNASLRPERIRRGVRADQRNGSTGSGGPVSRSKRR